jgi:hypothetical protein
MHRPDRAGKAHLAALLDHIDAQAQPPSIDPAAIERGPPRIFGTENEDKTPPGGAIVTVIGVPACTVIQG